MFDASKLKDPGYFRENRLDAHSDHAFYATEAEREEGRSSLRVSLNGLWKFFYARNSGQVPPAFEQEETDCRSWADISVPAHLQREGYGVPQYCNTEYAWDGQAEILPGELPERFNPVGCYVRYFTLPDELRGKRVFLRLEGAESCVAVWLNGQYIGFSSDSFTPHEFELTAALREGENKLACRVDRFCAGSWLEDQDFLRFSGLFRDVLLFAVPHAHVWDLRVTAEPAEDGSGCLRLTARTEGAEGGTLRAELRDPDGKLRAEAAWTVESGRAEGGMRLNDPRLWSAEHPWLYTLDLTLETAGGPAEYLRERVGFRKIEIRDSVIRINGVRVVFKGVNRHDFCGETGRAVTEESVRRDLILMKRNNINAVRTSHYPNAGFLYRLCDELGLYVIDENNMESHGMWDMYWHGRIGREQLFPGDQTAWQPLLLDRVRSMEERDKNHPCVVIWSCGNESLSGSVILEMRRELNRLDPTRPVHYEGDCHMPEEERTREETEIESQMYTPADRVREYLKTHREKPFILCEYTHSMGNSNGAMHKYTELAYEEELYQGGFIWDFVDQALISQDGHGREYLLYGGDWDDRPNDGIFCGNGIMFADGRPTPKLQEIKYNYQGIRADVSREQIRIRNRYMFTGTDSFRCVAVLERDGKEIGRKTLETAVAPLSSAVIPQPFELPSVPGEYALTVSFRLREETAWAPAGYEVAFGQGTWTQEGIPAAARLSHPPLTVTESIWNITVRGESFQAMFARGSGTLTSYRWGDTEYMKAPLTPNFWRAPTNNDYGNNMPQRYAQWKLASLYAKPGLTKDSRERNDRMRPKREEDGSVSLAFLWDLPTRPAAQCEMSFRVYPCGTVEVTERYTPAEGLGGMPEFGALLTLGAALHRVRFYGLGPEENYIDRREGARLGIWEYRTEENITPYLLPQECGNRTGVRWAEVTDARGHGLMLKLHGGEFSALPCTPHELENAQHGFELPRVSRTVLKVSARQMGVGGDDSWGARTHEEYLLKGDAPMSFTFSLRGTERRER